MNPKNVKVTLKAGESIVSRRALIERAAREMNRHMERDAATWEPHDWAEWS